MSIKKVTIVGAGTMGRQIALNSAISGFETILNDSNSQVLDAVKTWSKDYLAGRVAKGKLTQEQADKAASLFILEPNLETSVKNADLVIEAIIEKLDAKIDIFKKLDSFCPAKTILASNSSTYMPSQLAEGAPSRPDRYINMHYFNPVLVMKLLEIIMAPNTSDETLQACMEYGKSTGKECIVMRKELEGYIVNNILGGITNVAWFLLENGYASIEDIDKGAEMGLGHPMGPFRLLDISGLDTILAIRKARHEANPEKHPAPTQMLIDMVARNELGVKTGKGFYNYDKR